jgi:hypothetical protein
VKFKVLMVVKIQVEVFWVVTLCSVLVGYQHFGGPCYLCLQDEGGGSRVLRSTGILPQHYMVSQSSTPQLEPCGVIQKMMQGIISKEFVFALQFLKLGI